MKNISIALTVFLAFISTLLLAPDISYSKSPANNADKKGARKVPPPAGVKVQKVKKETIQETISIIGSVASIKTSRIGSETEGIVKEAHVAEGDYVKKDQQLLQLSNSQLKINIAAAKAEEEEAFALWKKAENEYERYKQLINDKVIDERLFTNSRYEAEASKSAYNQKKSNVNLLQDKRKKTTIYSPFSGVIISKYVEIGEWVNTGQQVYKISQVDPIKIVINVPETIVNKVKIGTVVDLKVEAIPEVKLKAKIYLIISEAKSGSRTFPVILTLNNPGRLLKTGMMVKALLPFGRKREALFVPRDAVTLSHGGNVVYVADNNMAKMVKVETGVSRKGQIEVNGAIKTGDLVVTRGGERLQPGIPITIIAQ